MNTTSNSIDSLSPLDGRYYDKTSILRPIFSERGLILYRYKSRSFIFDCINESSFSRITRSKRV